MSRSFSASAVLRLGADFQKTALAWWGSAHLTRAVSIVLLGLHGSVPNSLSIDFANAVLFASFALTWSGARVFDRRPPEPALSLVGVAIWLAACRFSGFADDPELRATVGAGIVAGYTWLTAYEFWRDRDEALVSRWPPRSSCCSRTALCSCCARRSASNCTSLPTTGWR
jgi:hypothetical protein